jgi:uncharacterized protein YabN with tetrapyrrole methylase and pyrophosphatase domain
LISVLKFTEKTVCVFDIINDGFADGMRLGFAEGLALGIADGLAFSFVNLRLVIFSVSDSMMVASLKLSLLETFSNGSVVLVISMISNKV